jgi:hypothetical protein
MKNSRKTYQKQKGGERRLRALLWMPCLSTKKGGKK